MLSVPGYEQKIEFGVLIHFTYPVEGSGKLFFILILFFKLVYPLIISNTSNVIEIVKKGFHLPCPLPRSGIEV